MSSDLRCWQCGVEPTGVVEDRRLSDPEPRYFPTAWPDGDHEHAVDKPSPEELVERGRRSFDRIMREWLS